MTLVVGGAGAAVSANAHGNPPPPPPPPASQSQGNGQGPGVVNGTANSQGRGHGNGNGSIAPPAPTQAAPAPPAPPAPAPQSGVAPGHGHGNGNGHGKVQVPGQPSGHAPAPQVAPGATQHGRGNGHGNAVAGTKTKGNGSGAGTISGASRAKRNGHHSLVLPAQRTGTSTTPTPAPTPAPLPVPVLSTPAAPAPAPSTTTPAVTPSPTVTPTRPARATPSRHKSSASNPKSGRATPSPSGLLTLSAAAAGGAHGLTGATAAPAAVTGALAAGTTRIGPQPARAHTRSRTVDPSGLARILIPPIFPGATVIERFVSVIPTGVWIALGALLLLAVVAGGAALMYRHREREGAREIAAVTATALTDPLTGVLNRRGFDAAAERELERARRYGHPLALAFVDVRGLKAVNDSQGHVAGDQLLKNVAAMLTESARTHDLVGRIGGDELAVLLTEQSAAGAAAMAGRVQEQVPVHRAALGFDAKWDVTIGTATFPEDGDSVEQLMRAADRRLYRQRGIEVTKAGDSY